MSTGAIYAREEFHENMWEKGQERRRLQKVDNIPPPIPHETPTKISSHTRCHLGPSTYVPTKPGTDVFCDQPSET